MSFVDEALKKLADGLSALARRVRALETKEHAGGGGGGTVTSVGLTMPSEFTVGGSPIVGAGVLGVVKAVESANTVWAGPVGGAPAVPTFRAIDLADLPALPPGGITQLTSDVLAGPGSGSQAATLKNTGPGATGPIGDATHTPVVTIDAQGRVTGLTSIAITDTGITQLTSDVLAGPGSGSQVATLKNTGPGATGPLGDATHIPVITIDAQGRVTALTSVAVTGLYAQFIFYEPAALAVRTGAFRIYNNLGRTVTISKVMLAVSTAPATQAIIVDIHMDGVTIFTNQAHRPQIAAAANTGNTTTIDIPTLLDGHYLTMDIDQVGSAPAGSDLTVHVVYS